MVALLVLVHEADDALEVLDLLVLAGEAEVRAVGACLAWLAGGGAVVVWGQATKLAGHVE